MGSTTVRPARPGDLGALLALLDRCSPETRYRRFHANARGPMRDEMARAAAPEAGRRSWVAVEPGGAVRGTATLVLRTGGAPEVALLVEDAWFRRGVGRAMVAAVARAARRDGAGAVVAWVQADNLRAVRFLRAVAPAARLAFDGGELAVRLPVADVADPAVRLPVADVADPAVPAVPAASPAPTTRSPAPAPAHRAWEAA